MRVSWLIVFLSSVVMGWTPSSWEKTGVPYQIPSYNTRDDAYRGVIQTLEKKAPLVFAGECRELKKELASVSCGKGFVLIGGDCAETFGQFSVNRTRDDYFLLLRMAMVLSHGSGVPVSPIGRVAGQFAKPRSNLWDEKWSCPAYQGDIINGISHSDRLPDPSRMIDAYHQSVQTLNLIRAFQYGGANDVSFLHDMNQKTFSAMTTGMSDTVMTRYQQHMRIMDQTIQFIKSTTRILPVVGRFYTGHECLLLPYEAALTRQDSTSDRERWYDTSAHFLWLGERTRKRNASHIEFMRGIDNPIGIKVSGSTDVQELNEILSVLNPKKEFGRIMIMVRMGADVLPMRLPVIIRGIDPTQPVLWCIDPMHGNTFEWNGVKTRSVSMIHNEIIRFFRVCRDHGIYPGGVHLEMTSGNVTECIGGSIAPIEPDDVMSCRYESACDPRLNGAQALETAFLISDILQNS